MAERRFSLRIKRKGVLLWRKGKRKKVKREEEPSIGAVSECIEAISGKKGEGKKKDYLSQKKVIRMPSK